MCRRLDSWQNLERKHLERDVIGTLTGTGRIWGVTSGGGPGVYDANANAVTHGRPLARGVIALGGSYYKNQALASFPEWATRTNVKAVAGDFNADGKADLALVGYSGWTSVPVAFGDGSGGFTVQNRTVSQFPALAAQARNVVAADFDGDGDTDLALTGKSTWTTIPMALSNRDGTFTFRNEPMATFPGLSAASGAYALAGDFDGDGDGDIALLGGAGWTSIPLALSNRNGTFSFQNQTVATFPALSRTSGAVGVAGDFDKDGDTDLALTGASGWASIPVAFSNRTGGFTTTNNAVDNFPGWAATSGRKIVAGDFDGDQDTDIAVVGPSGWRTIAMALSSGGGYFLPANLPINDIPRWATAARFALAGKVNNSFPGASNWDLILLGGSGWTTVPIAMLTQSY